MVKGYIHSIQTMGLLDGPGIRVVVFMQGCPWSCPFCHNASIRKILPENDFSWDLFFEFLKTRVGKLDAVTFPEVNLLSKTVWAMLW